MTTFILAILVIAYIAICIFLLGFILLQSGKGGGLSGLASSSPLTDSFGAAGSEKSLSKWTTYCTIAFFIITLLITFLGAQRNRQSSSLLNTLSGKAPQTQQVKQASAPTPAATVAGATAEGASEPAPAQEKNAPAAVSDTKEQPKTDAAPAEQKPAEAPPAGK